MESPGEVARGVAGWGSRVKQPAGVASCSGQLEYDAGMDNTWARRLLPIVVVLALVFVRWGWRSATESLTKHPVFPESLSSARAGVSTPDPLGEPDAELAAGLGTIAEELGIAELAARGRASVMLVDLARTAETATGDPVGTATGETVGTATETAARHAGINADSTLAAASITKLAILTAAYAAAEAGEIAITPDMQAVLERMIRLSANAEATRAIEILGFERIAATMADPRVALYSSARGGLWVGRDFTGGKVWRLESHSGESLAASAAAVARFYVLLARGEIVSPEASAAMREILAVTMWRHKFIAGLGETAGAARATQSTPARAEDQPIVIPGYKVWRKSGSYGPAQGDSALIEAEGRRYVLVCLLEDREGGEAKLQRLAAHVDQMMAERNRRGEPAGGRRNP